MRQSRWTMIPTIPAGLKSHFGRALASHPEAQLPTRRPCPYPIHGGVELCHSWHRRDAFTTQLRQLLALGRIYIDIAIHVADAEFLYSVLWMLLPLRT